MNGAIDVDAGWDIPIWRDEQGHLGGSCSLFRPVSYRSNVADLSLGGHTLYMRGASLAPFYPRVGLSRRSRFLRLQGHAINLESVNRQHGDLQRYRTLSTLPNMTDI